MRALITNRLMWLGAAALGTLLLAALAFGGALSLAMLRPAPLDVTLMIGGEAAFVQTNARSVADLLAELDVSLNAGDALAPSAETPLTANMVIQIDRARTVSVVIDGVEQTAQTLYTNPLDILDSLDVALNAADIVTIDGVQTSAADLLIWPVPATSINIRRARAVTIDDAGEQTQIETAAATVGDALFEAGVTLYLADTVTPDLSSPITDALTISISRSQPLSIIADGVTLETRTQGTTVGDALADAGVALTGLDYAIPAENTPLIAGMTIRIIRVTEIVEVEQTVIPFESVLQADAELELDQQVVRQEGQNGIQQTNIRIRYENGVEISRTPEGSSVALAPINRVVAYGTRIVLRTLDTPEGPREYWRVLRMYATSYHPAALGGDNITATGRVLTKGIVGIDPKVIPYGTQLYVPGYGVGVAADTGGPRTFRLWIDLGYDDENWVSWSKYVDVYLLTPLPEEIIYLLPER
ncbi:MAG: DUF348 domain-containing protein [Anaerolineae bacterium]|nr:DUF348 domain-containing protein [Anaerolineae bacterium]